MLPINTEVICFGNEHHIGTFAGMARNEDTPEEELLIKFKDGDQCFISAEDVQAQDLPSKIKELEEALKELWEDYREEIFNEEAPLNVDYINWVEKHCLDFETWLRECADNELYEELESLKALLTVEGD
jgi:hypothetical protein